MHLARRGVFGSRFFMSLWIRIPAVGESWQARALSRMAWSLSMAHDAGMDARRSMRVALQSTNNAFYSEVSELVDAQLTQGSTTRWRSRRWRRVTGNRGEWRSKRAVELRTWPKS